METKGLRFKNFVSGADLQKMYTQLKEVKLAVVSDAQFISWLPSSSFRGTSKRIINPPGQFQQIVRYWQDGCMAKCTPATGGPTPKEWLETNAPRLHTELKRGADRVEPQKMYDAWCAQTQCCSTFPPTVIMGLAQILGARSVLDPRAEWGDRLIGAAAAGLDRYIGVDANECTANGFRQIIKFVAADPAKFYIINEPFGQARIDTTFDLVFTGFPAATSLDAVEAVLAKAWTYVAAGGHMAISYANPAAAALAKATFANAEYLGVIIWGDTAASLTPIFVWYKPVASTLATIDPKKFEVMRFRHMNGKKNIERAFEIVREFIIKKGRLLGGGMSVDMAMRLRGSKLYADETLPDYDFLTPDNANDGYELGRLLCEAKLPDVDVIGAMHVTTQRVRVMGTVVADITYVPATIFSALHKLEFGGMHLLHPWYTMLDQFTALGMPYENPPHEVIIERWAKDIKRLHMLLPLYPIPKPLTTPAEFYDVPIPSGNCVLQGWGALAYYNSMAGWDAKVGTKFTPTGVAPMCKIPQQFVPIMTDDWESFGDAETKFFHSMMGFPRHLERPNLHIHDTVGLKIGILHSASPQPHPPVASLTALMWYFMHRWLRYGDVIDQYGACLTFEHMNLGSWKLDIYTYGRYVWNWAFVHYMREFNNVPGERSARPPPLFFMGDENPCDAPTPKFDPGRSLYFVIDGSPSERWEPVFDLAELEIRKGA